MVNIKIGALTRIMPNSTGYIQPDGSKTGPYGSKTGFNQEDWLNRANSGRRDAGKFHDSGSIFKNDEGEPEVQTYTHLVGFRKAQGSDYIAFGPDEAYGHLGILNNNELIGYFKKVVRLTEDQAKLAYDVLDSRGAGRIRELEAGDTKAWSSFANAPLNCINARYKPEDVILFTNPEKLKSLGKISGVSSVTIGTDTFEISNRAIKNAVSGNRLGLYRSV